MKMVQGFRLFARCHVIDMAVGVVISGVLRKIAVSFVPHVVSDGHGPVVEFRLI